MLIAIRALISRHFPSLRPIQMDSMEKNLLPYLEGSLDPSVEAERLLLQVRRSIEFEYSKAPAVKLAEHFRAIDRVELSQRCKRVISERRFDRAYYLAALGYIGTEPSEEVLAKDLNRLYQSRTEQRVMLGLTLGITESETVKVFVLALKARFPEMDRYGSRHRGERLQSIAELSDLSLWSIKTMIQRRHPDGQCFFPFLETLRKSNPNGYTVLTKSICGIVLSHRKTTAKLSVSQVQEASEMLKAAESYLANPFRTLRNSEGSRILRRGAFLLTLPKVIKEQDSKAKAFNEFADLLRTSSDSIKKRLSMVEDDALEAILSDNPLQEIIKIETSLKSWLKTCGITQDLMSIPLSAIVTLKRELGNRLTV